MSFKQHEQTQKGHKKVVYIWTGVFAVLLLGFGIFLGIVISNGGLAKCATKYQFVNAREVCGRPDIISKANYAGLQANLEKFIADQKTVGHLTDASVYFRDLEDGPIFGINENTDFVPASLLKLPLALVYLTQAERNPEILNEQLSVANPQWSFTTYFTSGDEIDPTVSHTVESLLTEMLKNYDNNAYGVLQTHFYDTNSEDVVTRTFLELGFINPTSTNDQIISVRTYASMFHALYNISYLNANLSEKVLGWLSGSAFTQGLVAGVPANIVVAHKFGERFTPDGNKQLHDCGIIYFPGNPYLLCVMTRGTNFDDLASVISHISGQVYAEVNSRKI